MHSETKSRGNLRRLKNEGPFKRGSLETSLEGLACLECLPLKTAANPRGPEHCCSSVSHSKRALSLQSGVRAIETSSNFNLKGRGTFKGEGSFKEGSLKGEGWFKGLGCSNELPDNELARESCLTLGRMDSSPPDPPNPAYLHTKPLREGITTDDDPRQLAEKR